MKLSMSMALAALLALSPAGVEAQATAPAGTISFENSGAPAAQAPFLRGLSLLHNFEYPRAAAAFREAQAADPGFALAYWGEAMTHNHTVWMAQDAGAARAILARLAPTRAERLARARTPRERAWLEAVEILYGEGSKEDRDRAYSAHMARLAADHPADVDAQAFYALSLLGLAHDGRDVRLYMRAAALLEPLYPDNRSHPGVLHYLIHSYDDPTHAPLGLRAARLYGDVAPDAPHARHMTSHIFLALGMWDEVIEANRIADAEVDRLRTAAGRPAASCGHYMEWLVYALHQRGRHDEAATATRACLDEVRRAASSPPPGGAPHPGPSWAGMAVRGIIETGEALSAETWREAGPDSLFTAAYADLLTAGGDAGRVRSARASLVELDRSAGRDEPPYQGRRRSVVLAQAEALDLLRSGETESGLAALRRAAEAERAMPAEFGPPLVEKPSFELLGDELLRLGRRDEAAAAYRAALELAPGRRLSELGLAAATAR
jgi:tetratricopeptide (TPR) repeat protein